MKIPRSLKVQAINWIASTLLTQELPHGVIKGLILKIDLKTTTGAGPALSREQLAGTVTKLDIIANGQDTIISIPGKHLYFMNFQDASKEPNYSIDNTASSSNRVQQLTLYLPFGLTRAAVPEDTLLDARNFSSLVCAVTWSAAAIGTNHTITSGSLRIETVEYANVDDAQPFARHEIGWSQGNLSATGRLSFNLDYGGNNQYKRLFVLTRDNSGALSNVQIDNIGVRSRAFYYLDSPADLIQDKNLLDYAIAVNTGVYVIDFTTDGKMSQRLDARNLSELVLEVNSLVANGTIEILKEKAIYI